MEIYGIDTEAVPELVTTRFVDELLVQSEPPSPARRQRQQWPPSGPPARAQVMWSGLGAPGSDPPEPEGFSVFQGGFVLGLLGSKFEFSPT